MGKRQTSTRMAIHSVRTTDEDWQRYRRQARKLGISTSQFIRECVQHSLDNPPFDVDRQPPSREGPSPGVSS